MIEATVLLLFIFWSVLVVNTIEKILKSNMPSVFVFFMILSCALGNAWLFFFIVDFFWG